MFNILIPSFKEHLGEKNHLQNGFLGGGLAMSILGVHWHLFGTDLRILSIEILVV